MDLFSRSWSALRTAVAELRDEDFAQPSGCTGWLVRDLVCHLIIDAQDVLITLVTPADTEPTRDEVLIAGDYLSAYVLESTLHHLDLIAHLPGAAEPPAEGLARSRDMLEKIAGTAFPASFSDKDALLVGTGRRSPTDAEKAELGELATKLPLVVG
ncbi:maleylpyruvate isomerase N-terminal domain-containing protein [Rhodococcus opacus]|uniref:Maleylpyruvate isomerase n=1 Tax=Rhodococcus opacus TaxID=37919 RepID=A0A076EQY6_RHOOP|nr:maleylpyruvate isomerase N-terminal domain-containing protein [Rhodococcus opacus]AII07607.1 maleylpyruvate isomerase [Rhodococcus opacus]